MRSVQFQIADRTQETCYGGLGLIHPLAHQCGLVAAIGRRLHLLKNHFPYHESDHMLNIAYNALTGGRCLEDLELKRNDNDEAYLNLIGAARIPDPTTAGDFTRRLSCNDRCNQTPDHSEEGLIEQLSNGPRAFQAPVDGLMSNWGYMLMGSLAWTLKAWLALWLPESGRWKDRRVSEKSRLLKMEFRTFVNTMMRVPCQIVRTGRCCAAKNCSRLCHSQLKATPTTRSFPLAAARFLTQKSREEVACLRASKVRDTRFTISRLNP